MTLECHKLSPRLIWIVENYTGEGYRKLTNLIRDAQKEGSVRDIDPARLRFAIMAMAAVPFSISAEYQLLTKKNPFSRKEIESTIELINELVFRQ
jgi:TetR/AcrR family transcriptional regulator